MNEDQFDDGSGYAFCMGPCLLCKKPFTFNPLTVPSFRIPETASKEPVCRPCIELVNVKRKEMGLEPWSIPADAYEPVQASRI